MKITNETRRWLSSGPGNPARTMGRPATSRTMSLLTWVTPRLCSMPISRTAQMAHWVLVDEFHLQRTNMIRGSIVVSISACHAEDPGSIPGRGGCASRGQLGHPLRAQRQTRTQLIHELASRSRQWSS